MKRIGLPQWLINNKPKEEMLYYKGYNKHWDIVDRFLKVLTTGDKVEVIATHISESILLPIIQITTKNYTIILRDNFHNIKISILSRIPIDIPLLYKLIMLPDSYLEEFFGGLVYACYSLTNNKVFSLQLSSDYYKLYTLLFLLKHAY